MAAVTVRSICKENGGNQPDLRCCAARCVCYDTIFCLINTKKKLNHVSCGRVWFKRSLGNNPFFAISENRYSRPAAGEQNKEGASRTIVQNAYLQTCCRHSGIISLPIPMSALTVPRGEFFPTNWTGEGGDTAASTYNA